MEIKALLQELEIRPHKGLGQNFLVDERVLKHILDAAEVGAQDTVLEIGPGLGTLTNALAESARHVVAVEIDPQLVTVLRDQLKARPNVEIVHGDILRLDIPGLLRSGLKAGPPAYKVVANIPYYITSAVLRHLLEASIRPLVIVLMVQREVAQRITAGPGEMSLLAVSVQFYGQPRLVRRVPAGAFYPVPKVDSAIIRVDPYSQLPLPAEEISPFFDVVRAGFGQRRKQLRNALAHGLRLPAETIAPDLVKAGIDISRRAQTLSVREWTTLYRALRDSLGSGDRRGRRLSSARDDKDGHTIE
jgi:16S rRNA (adenine1518-N6/adenine1519-N6)-dimethyltransferase